ncbi:ethylbenzene dehydrogenase-related protein [Marinobacter sp. ELB17]|uniref:ethylbenzene dehydrogenase-related protein n=1 Tax=Marinobacter sp. ELB17 TaxID=270374 RepID=UPI0000F39B9E|nr:ethylbenzene dehydrogenase-related protein [Marinobacter sp. ELB17]EAZ99854.1 probable di-heme cytochrome c [Marinobacter sp. ELB17]
MARQDKTGILWLALGLPIALGLAWVTQGSGVIEDDPERNISIPDELNMPLQVQAAYNDERIFFRYRWPSERPHILHDVLVYENGDWVKKGSAVPGSNPDGLHEDRVAMMLDDGSVPDFARYGGYMTIGAGAAGFTDEAPEEVTKSMPGTRIDLGDWASRQAPETLQAQREAGYFLDLWHWRGHRSNPLNLSDDQWVGAERSGDAGRSPYTTNWDGDAGQPLWMLDPEVAGQAALRWEDIEAGRVDFDSPYFLAEDTAIDFDPNQDWQNGDVIPRRLVRQTEGSRGDITVLGEGRWNDGYWDVTLSRRLDTGNPLDDKILHDQGLYTAAFAVHRNATGGRWHLVSLPVSLGLGRDADLTAIPFQGRTPDWADDWKEVTLFYPGQVNWPLLVSRAHAGAPDIAEGTPVHARHSERQLAIYGVEMEFNDAIIRQWILTLIAGLIAMFGVVVALLPAFRNTSNNRKGEPS